MSTRTRDHDACPGALTVHHAADGALVRFRLPGGLLTPGQLQALARAATEFGSPAMELTSRGNIQIRGVGDPAAVAEIVAAAGLLPSATHERVRNIVASPLSGRSGGRADIRDAIHLLDKAIQHEPVLTALPGRFLFGLDDGRGDICGLRPDVSAYAFGDGTAALLLAGRDSGIRLRSAEIVPALITVAVRFCDIRGKAWRIGELADPGPLLAEWTATAPPLGGWPPSTRPPVGWISQDDGRVTLAAAVPLGVLQARVAEFLAAIEAPMVITPWRSLLVCDLDEGVADTALRVLAPMGLIFDAGSPWLDVSACTGSPGCERSTADVRATAAEAAQQSTAAEAAEESTAAEAAQQSTAARHRHFVGCERACGSPAGSQVLIVTAEGCQHHATYP